MNEDKVLQKLLDHDDRLERIEENMATKKELNSRFDEMMVILKRLYQERVFTSEWIKRIESEVAQHTIDLKNLKQHLQIS